VDFDLLILEDVCVDCIISELRKSGDRTETRIAAALHRGRHSPSRDYERELRPLASRWPRVLRAVEFTCRRRFKRCPE
jgi:streptomycin 6-kinase